MTIASEVSGASRLNFNRKAFLTRALFGVTIVPLFFYAILMSYASAATTFYSVIWAIGAVGVTHVGMTGYFYAVDRRYSTIINADKWRYYVLPFAVVVGALIAFTTFTNEQLFWYFLIHYAWLLWHFNRQNYGLYAMFLRSEGQPPMSPLERKFFDYICVGAIPVALTLYPDTQKPLGPWTGDLIVVGRVLFLVCAAGLVAEAYKLKRFRSRTCASWLGLSILFFVPTIIALHAGVALAFYAHPLQYIVMMLVVANAESDNLPLTNYGRIAALVVIGISLFAVISAFQYGYVAISQAGRVALAIGYGATQWHFLADAGLWRMRDAGPRRNFEESFAFMFQRAK